METTYAQALWKLLENGMQPKKAVNTLHAALEAKGRAALLPRIGRAFARLAAREMRKGGLVLTVADEKAERRARTEAKETIERLGADSKELEVRVDASLVGGWRLEGRGQLIDASYKKSLLELYQRATNADAPTQGRGPDRARVGI